MMVKDRTSVLNQNEQAVSQLGCSYPLEPRSPKQDFAVDSHYTSFISHTIRPKLIRCDSSV